jgi:predicted nucleotidyltransferase component of viral defense system
MHHMTREELLKYIRELGISADQILREEAEMEILDALAKDKISQRLIFYGGTALRLAYGCPRFSEDVDLLDLNNALNFSDFKEFAIKIAESREGWRLADLKNKRKTIFALINIRDEKIKHAFSIKIEIHKPAGKVSLDYGLRLLKSPVSPAEPLLLVPELYELKRLKIDALGNRKKARDFFDLWFIAQLMREEFSLPENNPGFSEREFKNELKVFLPRKYYAVIDEIYEKISRKN